MAGALRPPKIFGQIVRCSSSTRPARNKASFNSPPPSQSSRLTPHFSRSQQNAARKLISRLPQIFTSSATARSWRKLRFRCPPGGEDDDGRETVFENFRAGIDRAAAADDDAQIILRQPVFKPQSPEFGRPGPRLMAAESTVRAPAITASAVARNSSKCSRSRALPNERHRAIRRRDFSVRRHRHVHENERQLWTSGLWTLDS